MTIEELKQHCVRQITEFERIKEIMPVTLNGYKRYEEHKIVLQLIEAWEKVRAEIEILYEYTSREDYIHQEETRAFIDKSEVLEIIDKHIAEIRGDTDG
ncbi:MAG: hypothetical protein IKN54_00260 [Lachnospiraceae bacterium]|nr:hypothetical protein [Lachnospiraceae bacterium]